MVGCNQEDNQKSETNKPLSSNQLSVTDSAKELKPVAHEQAAPTPMNQLTNLIADKSCDSNAQCQVVGIGHRACGGFERYEAYSTKTVDQQTVKDVAQAVFDNQKLQNEKNNMVSICQHVAKPPVACKANQCVTLNLQQHNDAH